MSASVFNPLHPFRLFQLNEHWNQRLREIRQALAASHREDGVIWIPLDFDRAVPWEKCRNVQDVEASVFMQKRSFGDLSSFERFWTESRQVFHFNPKLAAMLAETDVDDVPWSELRFPHKDFYVGWGDYGQRSFDHHGHHYVVEGAYVKCVDDSKIDFLRGGLALIFACRLIHPTYREAIGHYGKARHFKEPVYEYVISPLDATSVGEAISNGEAASLKHADALDIVINEMAANLARQRGMMTGSPPIGAYRMLVERAHPVVRPFLPVLFNCIFYLTQFPEHITLEFPPQAPRDLVKQATSAFKPNKREQAEVEIRRRGFSRVRYVVDPTAHDEQTFAETGSRHDPSTSVSTHWRRGHWRRQPHGPDLTLIKRLWIKPVLVNAANGEVRHATLHSVADIPDQSSK